jgi:hypothetical protein
MRQGLGLEPLLQAISDFLDDQQDMIEQIRSDLVRGLENAETGRSGLTPQQVLRSLVLMRGKNWHFREFAGADRRRITLHACRTVDDFINQFCAEETHHGGHD